MSRLITGVFFVYICESMTRLVYYNYIILLISVHRTFLLIEITV